MSQITSATESMPNVPSLLGSCSLLHQCSVKNRSKIKVNFKALDEVTLLHSVVAWQER